MTSPQVDNSARQRGFEIRVFPLLGELPRAIKSHLPVCQLYNWQLGPNMWSSPTTKPLDPIVVTTLRVDFPRESHRQRHMWICLQLSGARGVDNRGVTCFSYVVVDVEMKIYICIYAFDFIVL